MFFTFSADFTAFHLASYLCICVMGLASTAYVPLYYDLFLVVIFMFYYANIYVVNKVCML